MEYITLRLNGVYHSNELGIIRIHNIIDYTKWKTVHWIRLNDSRTKGTFDVHSYHHKTLRALSAIEVARLKNQDIL